MTESHFDFSPSGPIDLSDPQQALGALGITPRNIDCQVTAVRIAMRDGIELAGDHFAPLIEGSAPTILVRSPYGRGFPFDLVLARVFAGAGYHVLLQSCRGTADSDGMIEPMVQEAADGNDTVEWLREQSWFDGRLGLVGMSYLAYCVYALLQDPSPEVKAAAVIVGPYDFSEHFYRTGAFTLQETLNWSNLVRRPSPEVEPVLPPDAEQRLPLLAAAELLGPTAPWFTEWVTNPDLSAPIWDAYNHRQALEEVTVPVLQLSGSYDVFLPQTLHAFGALRDRGIRTALTLGPWVHNDVVGKGANIVVDESQSWFDGISRPEVPLYVEGVDEWRELAELPSGQELLQLRLTNTGALTATGDSESSTFTYDPANPTPAVGGRRVTDDGGAQDNASREQRPDVLTFTTDPFDQAIEILGTPTLTLGFALDNPHADLHARLCVVDAAGVSINFSDAMLRLPIVDDPTGVRTVELTLDFCARRIAAGQRIRLQISGGSFPEYDRNLGTGEPAATSTAMATSTRIIDHSSTLLVLPTSQPA